ncbi:MAG: CmcJ/NvfI family oxidoreductase [Alphaproteobacteria bacterium]
MIAALATRQGGLSRPGPGREDIWARLTFGLPQDGKPYFESAALTGDRPKLHHPTDDHLVTLHDMRPLAPSLDHEGFELRRHETAVGDLYDDNAVAEIYDREIEDLLKAMTGAIRVAVFDRTRRSDNPKGAVNPDGPRGPAGRVHVDYTARSGPRRARDILSGAEVDRVLATGGRIAQVNVWRPITGPVRRAPLALADASTVRAEDLIATDQIFPDRVGEIYQLSHAPHQRWYWAPEMERDEVLLIKGWDSLDDGRAQFTPHGAFDLPGQDPGAPARESIEVRAYLIFEGDHHD